MKITVLFLIDSLQVFGGAEKNLFTVSSSLNPDKYRTIVCCLKDGDAAEIFRNKGINIINLRLQRIYSFDAIKKAIQLISIIRKEKVKIVVTYLESSDFWGGIVAKVAGVPIVISNRRDLGFNLKHRHILAYRIVNTFFDKIISVCEAVKWSIVKREKVSPDKIITIFNGIEKNNDLVFNSEALRTSLGLDTHKKIVTMIANLEPIKGHKDFLMTAAKVLKQYSAVQFLLVGGGKSEYEQELRYFSAQLGIADNVLFAGFRRDVAQILSISDISILTSSSEGCSNTILESMSAGIPVIATNVGGNPEVVIDGETGLLIPAQNLEALANAILRFLRDKKLAEKMGDTGKNHIERLFRIDKMIQETEYLFEALLIGKESYVRSKSFAVVKRLLLKMAKLSLANLMFYTRLNCLFKKISAQRNSLTILAYHRINDSYSGPDGMSISCKDFENQILHLKKNYNLISLEQAVDCIKSHKQLPENSVAVTFDDGYKDNYTQALSILKKYSVPVTIFLSVGAIEENKPIWFDVVANSFDITKQKFIDLSKFNLKKYTLISEDNRFLAKNETISFAKKLQKYDRENLIEYLLNELEVERKDISSDGEMLNWEEIKEMRDEGISFGSHGVSHSILTRIPKEELTYEIEASKQIIEKRMGISIKFFAYPNGQARDFNESIAQMLKKSDYEAGFTLLKGSNNGASDMFALRRLCISQASSKNLFNRFSPALFDIEILGVFRLFKSSLKARSYVYD